MSDWTLWGSIVFGAFLGSALTNFFWVWVMADHDQKPTG